MTGMLRDHRGVPRSLPAYVFLTVLALVPALSVVCALAAQFMPLTPTLIVPATVVAVAIGRLGFSRIVTTVYAVCAALGVLLSMVRLRPTPPERRPLGLADPCRRVEAVLLAGPRAPGVRAA
ncbi:hypothetical protein [Gordonia sp. (in: high G+C Gram-positive bacteria)]|uniref:hypothetical protein n=1 Tax=Gordonia sp. (in: high G+C Gram-positive bacteria) TaxID=84139 RepID=UPI003F97B12B